ncbi:MAG TPA: sigma-70 family RNA polymerase sigma factor [Anaeromyxobacteraceae bacterium]|nr:sigma-70 family RNA polymerase sigma factor [Anaeromyxobacteraceae bacterium]
MTADGEDDVELQTIARAVAGDAAALRTLHDRHRHAVHRVARSFATFDPDDVEDVVQEAFVSAFRNLGRLEDPRRFLAWLLTITRNRALTKLARRRTEAEATADLSRELDVHRAAETAPPDPDAAAEIELVRRIVAELPEGAEKETVRLFYVEGKLSAREIAKLQGVGKSAITMRLERFRAKVKQRILAEVAALCGRESED